MTAKEIQWLLAKSWGSPFFARRHLCVVPNVSWGFNLLWEADLLVLSKSGFLTEVEIKISLSDWRADLRKKKFGCLNISEDRIKRFWYAAPMTLARRFEEIGIQDFAGVIGCDTDNRRCEVLKPAKGLPHRKINEKEKLILLRLAALKAWDIEPPKSKQLEFSNLLVEGA